MESHSGGAYPFANRTDLSLEPNELTRTLNALKEQKIKICDLTVSNPTCCGLDYPSDRIVQILSDANNLFYSPDPHGLPSARSAVQDYYRQKGIQIPLERIFLTSSTSEAYSFICRLLVNVDQGVLVPAPSYPLFHLLLGLNDVMMNFYPIKYEKTWQIDLEYLDASEDNQSKAILLVNPNNPTGSYVGSKELLRINHLCKEHKMAIICDEVFHDFELDPNTDKMSLAQNEEVLTFVLGGLSKSMGMPQMKLSWIILNGPDEIVKEASARLEVITDTYLSVNTPVQNAFPEWMQLKDMIQKSIKDRILNNYHFARQYLENIKEIIPLNAEGGWYLILRVNRDNDCDDERLALSLLRTDHVYVHPGYFFDLENEPYLVLSLLVPEHDFQEGVAKIVHRVQHFI